jgi:spore germination protein
MKRTILLPVLALIAMSAAAAPQNPPENESPRPVFQEIWAYLVQGQEKQLTGQEPITDLCSFGAGLTKNGRIYGAAARPVVTLKDGLAPAVHLVVAELSNSALLHFALDPAFGVRPVMVSDIVTAAAGYDGVQIDFEAVAADDGECFIDFLKELRGALPLGKRLSVALPARLGRVEDAYEYGRIAPIVDRMIIMAYDEHWSTSGPGPVASLPWCSKVADYVKSAVPLDKIVMGLPLYGRSWQDKKLARALRFQGVQDLLTATNGTPDYTPEAGAHFEYSETVQVSVFYDDARTIQDKLRLYQRKKIRSVSFWRVGQGPPEVWDGIERAGAAAAAAPDPALLPTVPAGP